MADPALCPVNATCPGYPMDGCYLTNGEGYAVLFSCLGVFAVVAGLAIPLMMRELRRRGLAANSIEGTDFWYSARNSQGWLSIAFSICATSAGGWLLYTPGEAAVVGGWWALLGYCVAIAMGPLVMCYFAPKFREAMPDSANVTDWVLKRFGPVAHAYVTLILIYYMFIYLVGQLKTMGDMMTKFTGLDPEYGIIPLAGVTVLYTMVGGFPASIVTDWVQAGCILVFVFGVCVATWTWVDVSSENWRAVAGPAQGENGWTDRGFEMATSLCFAVFGAEVFNLAFWQRIYAARDVRELRIGFVVGALLVSLLTFLFGITSLLLKAHDLGNPCGAQNAIPAFIFFEVLNLPQTTKGLRILLFVLVVSMIASNADSFQTAITSTLSRFLQRQRWPSWQNVVVAEFFVLLINVPAAAFAIYAAHDNASDSNTLLAVRLTDLFSMADILTITLVVPLFAGLWAFVTRRGALLGMFAGLLFIVAWGWVEFGTFMSGMEMITMMCFGNIRPEPSANGAPGCGFYSWRASIMFPVIPVLTGFVTFMVSFMERSWEKLLKVVEDIPTVEPMKPYSTI